MNPFRRAKQIAGVVAAGAALATAGIGAHLATGTTAAEQVESDPTPNRVSTPSQSTQATTSPSSTSSATTSDSTSTSSDASSGWDSGSGAAAGTTSGS